MHSLFIVVPPHEFAMRDELTKMTKVLRRKGERQLLGLASPAAQPKGLSLRGYHEMRLADQLAKEFLLVHAVLEGFATIDEDDRDFIVELAAQFVIGVHVDFAPGEAATAGKLHKAFFHNFAEMATFAGIDDDAAWLWHARVILARKNATFYTQKALLCAGPKPWAAGIRIGGYARVPRQASSR